MERGGTGFSSEGNPATRIARGGFLSSAHRLFTRVRGTVVPDSCGREPSSMTPILTPTQANTREHRQSIMTQNRLK